MFKKFGIVTLTLFVSVTLAFCQQEENKTKKSKAPEITFEQTVHNFGKLPYKGDGTYEFVFKNTGKEPLVLTNVKSSCGCTVPTYPKDPIKKGKKGVIKVTYDTKRQGPFHKTITVHANAANSPIRLSIKGEVEKPSEEELAAQRKARQEQAAKRRAAQQRNKKQNFLEKDKTLPEKK